MSERAAPATSSTVKWLSICIREALSLQILKKVIQDDKCFLCPTGILPSIETDHGCSLQSEPSRDIEQSIAP